MSKSEKLYDGITEVKDYLVEQARTYPFSRKKQRLRKLVVGVLAAGVALAFVVGSLPPKSPADVETPNAPASLFPTAYALSLPDYQPTTDVTVDYERQMEGYLRAVIPALLTGEEEENTLCSPLNVYMALAMLTEMTAGETRQQLLDLLGCPDLESARDSARTLWSANYRNGEGTRRVLGSSLWLNQAYSFRQETLDALAQHYYAASYSGEMGDAAFDQALHSWLNQHTGGLLQDQVADITLDPGDLMNLYTTVYFKGRWDSGFSPQRTTREDFQSSTGAVSCDMMHKSTETRYYWGENFSAVFLSFETGGMWLILPDTGKTPADLLADGQVMDFLMTQRRWENAKYLTVHMSVPKFDITTQGQLKEPLQALGVTRVFDPETADMSPLSSMPAYLSQLAHGVRVRIDEEGCEAAAYVEGLTTPTAAPPPEEEVYFTLDRPFLFLVTGAEDLPLFAGIVNQP